MRLTQPNETLKHTDRLPVLANLRILTQELVVGVQDDFSFFTNDRFKHFLDECDVLAELIGSPQLAET